MKKRQETLVPSISFSWNLRRAFCPVAPETAEHLIFPLLCLGGSQFTPSLFPTIRYVPCRMMYDLDGRQEVENEPAVLCTHAGSMTNHRSWMRRPPPASPATNDTFAEHAFQAERFHQELVNGFHSLRICFRLFVDRRRVFDVWPLLQGGNYFVFVDD